MLSTPIAKLAWQPPLGSVQPVSQADDDPRITAELPSDAAGVAVDSRLVQPGDIYVALAGASTHGIRFAAQAVAAGAVAILTDSLAESQADPQELGRLAEAGIPVVTVPDPRAVMGPLAAAIYGDPAARMRMFAVTGTNGKTTTTHLLQAALRALGQRVGIIGTNGFAVDGEVLERPRTTVTTPESPDLHALLEVMNERGATDVVMEVSSIAMAYRRTAGARFAVSAFTNLGRDHLDFHTDMADYFAAKASLFTPEHTDAAVVVIDEQASAEDWGRRLADRVRRAGELLLLTVGATDADFTVLDAGCDTTGRTRVRAATPEGELNFSLALPGAYNVRNALTALAMVSAAGLDPVAAAGGLAEATVPGRMQRIWLNGNAPTVYVDFAHTPQAVDAALAAAGEHGQRVIAVLGCGGDRDRAKREPMGAAAARRAAVVLITDDNPRGEDPVAIRAAALDGARTEADRLGSARAVAVHDGGDRRSAIETALRIARPEDVVAVLGKGHEQGQEIAGRTVPFDDAQVIADTWRGVYEAGS